VERAQDGVGLDALVEPLHERVEPRLAPDPVVERVAHRIRLRALYTGRSRKVSTPGSASQTSGMALITCMAVSRQPAWLWSPTCDDTDSSSFTHGSPSTSMR